VKRCADAGIVLAVNQNMRFDQSVRAAKDILNRGWIGEPVFASIDMRAIPHWMPWAEGLPSLSTFVMSIHHLDTFRYLFGDPERVFCSVRADPRTRFPHQDGICLYILEYANGLRCSAWDDVWAGPAREGAEGDLYIKWRVEGTEGMADGTIGWPKYPVRSPSTLRFTSLQDPGRWHTPTWAEVWFPDAFEGPMAQLMEAVYHDRAPEISGEDNLRTMALVDAAYRSVADQRAVSLAEVADSVR
jgi:predicted dehydrogenase